MIRSPLTHTSLLTLSGIPAKIESDRKRKKSPVVPAEQKEKHKQHLNKTKKMSYCSNSHGGDGGEVRASHILVKHQGSRHKASWKDAEGQVIRNTTRDSAISQLKAFRDEIVSVKSKFEDIASRSSDCSSANHAGELGSQVEDMATKAGGYNRVVEENRKLFNMVQDLKDEVFKDTQPLIRSVMDGYNVCIFAYGQTGSRKTYTMSGPSGGTSKDMGINYLALNDLFRMSNDRKDIMTYDIYVQMVEIYNEQVRDLLAEDKIDNKLEIRSCNDDGLSLPDATLRPVTSTTDVLTLVKLGKVNRAVSSTALNNRSSRSHSKRQDLLFVLESLYQVSLSDKAEWRWMPIEKNPNNGPETLDNVSRVFHIKYTRIDEDSSPDVMVLSGSEPSDDEFSSDGDENNDQDGTLVGDNPHNPIDLSGGSTLLVEVHEQSNETNEFSDHRYTPEVYYEKIITASDLGQSRLYLASKFAAYLKQSGDGSIWTITSPRSNVEKNVFFFH
ncbi:hypothetical protein AHAS_Ahas11G0083300 [Arachis hypogaea]